MVDKDTNSKYISLPFYIFRDKRLNYVDIALISLLYSLIKEDAETLKVKKEYLLKNLGIEKGLLHKALKRLNKFGWLKDVKKEKNPSRLIFRLAIPEKKDDVYHQPGSEIARLWSNFFGSRMLKYEELQDLKDFVENHDVEEELIIRVMELASEQAEGNPFYYIRAVLINLIRNGILTVEDYEKEKGASQNGKISGNNRKKEEKHSKFKADEYR